MLYVLWFCWKSVCKLIFDELFELVFFKKFKITYALRYLIIIVLNSNKVGVFSKFLRIYFKN